jgi:hypothetical protein
MALVLKPTIKWHNQIQPKPHTYPIYQVEVGKVTKTSGDFLLNLAVTNKTKISFTNLVTQLGASPLTTLYSPQGK